jgi:hypothetical protein
MPRPSHLPYKLWQSFRRLPFAATFITLFTPWMSSPPQLPLQAPNDLLHPLHAFGGPTDLIMVCQEMVSPDSVLFLRIFVHILDLFPRNSTFHPWSQGLVASSLCLLPSLCLYILALHALLPRNGPQSGPPGYSRDGLQRIKRSCHAKEEWRQD